MIFKPKIPKTKNTKKVLQTLSLFTLALVCTLTINTLKTHANEYDAWAKTIVDSAGSGSAGGTQTVPHGVWTSYTGYLCYLLDSNGNAVPGTNAIALSSPGFNYYTSKADTEFLAKSRKGNYVAGTFSGTAPWACTPWSDYDSKTKEVNTHEPTIREWFEKTVDNQQQGIEFVFKNWGEDLADRFKKNEVHLVIETLMHFQFSEAGKVITGYNAYSKILDKYNKMSNKELLNEAPAGLQNAFYDGLVDYDDIRDNLLSSLLKLYREEKNSFKYVEPGWTLVGDPVVGTVPNLIDYKWKISPSKNLYVFDSFLNKVAPFAERTAPGGIGEQLGFTAWTGSTSSKISDAQVKSYGLAMIVISANTDFQSTYDEKLPDPSIPHRAPEESEGTYTIVKNYRTKLSETEYQDDGCFNTPNVGPNITIENEEDYKVIAWQVTDQATLNKFDSIKWLPPGTNLNGGLELAGDTHSIVIKDPGKCLYVLLEKSNDDIQTTADEPKIPNPHPPKKESDGDYTIVKNYRTYDPTTNTYSDGQCHSISNISSSIKIEDEKDYKVIEWKVTDNATYPIDSYPNWSPPGTPTQTGDKSSSTPITLAPLSDKCLYVLLEKTTASTPTEVPTDYNYLMTQSTITKRVRFSTFEAPDSPQNNMNAPYIQSHPFQWKALAHKTSCSGHQFTAACKADHVGPHTSSCPSACSSTCTQAHTHSTGCSDPHYYDCGERCQRQTQYCKDWDWLETSLKLSINNALQSEYPDILATKQGYNTEPSTGGLVKKYFEVTLQYCTVQKNRTPQRCPVQKFHFSIPINFLTNKSSNYSIPNFLQLIYIYS